MAELSPITVARFWSKVAVGHPTHCWPWKGGSGEAGYGRFRVDGALVLAHRLAYEIFHGPLPETPDYHGAVVRHSCDNPPCCNPHHLLVGSQRDNVGDMQARGRERRARGEAAGNSRLTAEQVMAIRRDPRSHREIAKAFGVGHNTVGKIKRGQMWAHIVGRSDAA